eukprot:393802_1
MFHLLTMPQCSQNRISIKFGHCNFLATPFHILYSIACRVIHSQLMVIAPLNPSKTIDNIAMNQCYASYHSESRSCAYPSHPDGICFNCLYDQETQSRCRATSQTPGKVYALEYDDANNMDNGDEPSEAEGVHEDVNQLVTPTGGPPHIAPDEFVVVGDGEHQDGNTTQGFGNNSMDEVVAVGEGSGSCGTKY